MTIDEFVARFAEEPGYLDFARVGPLSAAAAEEAIALIAGARSVPGSAASTRSRDAGRAASRRGVRASPGSPPTRSSSSRTRRRASCTRCSASPAASRSRRPSSRACRSRRCARRRRCTRAARSGSRPTTARSRPARSATSSSRNVVAVAVSLVDFRTGYLVDLEGIRQVIGDRLLIVDATQGFGVVDAPYEVADVVADRWAEVVPGRLGHRLPGALRPRARAPHARCSRGSPPPSEGKPLGRGAAARARGAARVPGHRTPTRSPQARFAAGLEEIAAVGVADDQRRGRRTGQPRSSTSPTSSRSPWCRSRDERERAGIVVLEPPSRAADGARRVPAQPRRHRHGARHGQVRLSLHADDRRRDARRCCAPRSSRSRRARAVPTPSR